MRTERVLNDQFAAAIIVGLAQEQGCRQISAYPMWRSRHLPDGGIDMSAEALTLAVAVKHRRKHLQRQRRREKRCRTLKSRNDHFAELQGDGMALR